MFGSKSIPRLEASNPSARLRQKPKVGTLGQAETQEYRKYGCPYNYVNPTHKGIRNYRRLN